MEMEITKPNQYGFTIYSKSGCPNCTLVKKIIREKHFFYKEINCDEYILEDKEKFLTFIENISEITYKTFPMVFYDGKIVGGVTHTTVFIDKFLLPFEDIF
jgi:glutaredoxin